jgi:hypothetical protein
LRNNTIGRLRADENRVLQNFALITCRQIRADIWADLEVTGAGVLRLEIRGGKRDYHHPAKDTGHSGTNA